MIVVPDTGPRGLTVSSGEPPDYSTLLRQVKGTDNLFLFGSHGISPKLLTKQAKYEYNFILKCHIENF